MDYEVLKNDKIVTTTDDSEVALACYGSQIMKIQSELNIGNSDRIEVKIKLNNENLFMSTTIETGILNEK